MSLLLAVRGGSRVALAVGLTLLTSHVRAADGAEAIITASRISEPADETLWSSDVLDRTDIDARQVLSVQDLLAPLSGIDVHNAGGFGKATTVFFRGTESDQTLLLIDGVRVGSATLGLPPFELLPVDQIERIEVVRGPRSTLYGSDAIGGVVQIFTRGRPQGGFSADGSAGFGSNDLYRASAHVSAGGDRAWLNIGGGILETDGFNSCSGQTFPGAGCFTEEPDADGFRNRSGSFAAGTQIGEHWSAELHSLIADGHTEYDGTFVNETDFTERVGSLQIKGALSEDWHLRTLIGRNDDESDNFLNGAFQSRFHTRRNSASVQLDGSIGPALSVITGADYHDDRIETTDTFMETERSTTGTFAELHGDAGALSALAGIRYEDNEQFGSHITQSAGAAFRFAEAYRMTYTWGEAFRAPTFNELYFPLFGNPALDPEESRSHEIGFEGQWEKLRFSVHAYQTDFDQLISVALDPGSGQFIPLNIAEARIRGAELASEWRDDVWTVTGRFTALDARDVSPGIAGERQLPRRARRSASLQVRHTAPWATLGGVARWQGPRFDDVANTRELGGYLTIDLAAEVALGDSWSVQALVSNALDRDYTTAAFFNNEGRQYTVTVRYRSLNE